jgi:hypothetical protein
MPSKLNTAQSSFDFDNHHLEEDDGLSPMGCVVNGSWYAVDFNKMGTIEDRLHAAFDFARERHAIYLRRSRGLPKPWTRDPILSGFRFCNIYRQLDTVSIWINENIIQPYEDDPNLWFMLCAARVINWPPSLTAMMDVKGGFGIGGRYDPYIACKALKARKDAGEKVVTGAYLVNSVASPDDPDLIRGDKLAFVTHKTLGHIWPDRDKLTPRFKRTLQESVETLMEYKGYGAFTSYQITVDLSYNKKWLAKAPDINTFNAAGPGTKRGLGRIYTGDKGGIMQEDVRKCILHMHKIGGSEKYWPQTSKDMSKGFAPIELSNVSNLNCEFDKYVRTFNGEGSPRSVYEGVPRAKPRENKSLF